ncbi:MAG: MarR family transcriptional regulator [Spirochaetales bacterium]|nr:MarR family transcriptional regulator [Spirochaetales bacterium]
MEISGEFINFFDQIKELLLSEELSNLLLDFSKNDWLTLFFLLRKEEANMGQIAEYLHCPLNTATGVVNRLVNKALILRSRDNTDRRIVRLRLTPRALKLAEEYRATISEYFSLVNGMLTQEERNLLISVFGKVRSVLLQRKQSGWDGVEKPVLRKIEIG